MFEAPCEDPGSATGEMHPAEIDDAAESSKTAEQRFRVIPDDPETTSGESTASHYADCRYIFEKLCKALPENRFRSVIGEEYPYNITVNCLVAALPQLVIMRRRNGAFIAGPAGGPPVGALGGALGAGEGIGPDDLTPR